MLIFTWGDIDIVYTGTAPSIKQKLNEFLVINDWPLSQNNS